MLATAVAVVTTCFAIAGIGYYAAALWSARSFAHSLRRRPEVNFAPPVSILKPVKGLDPSMYAAFASHCRQQYAGEYEILFGVGSLDDPAVPAIRQLQAEFPERDIRIVECPLALGPNGKVSNLAQMLPLARHAYILVNDSDILVSPHYLSRILAAFVPAPQKAGSAVGRRVGMVTTLYRGRAHGGRKDKGTLGARLEALGIATDLAPGVLMARWLEGGVRFGLGSTLAFSRAALEAAGGFAGVVAYLADDYQLGARVHEAGFEVALAADVVETSVPAYPFRGFLAHQLRWNRSMRDSRRGGYAGLLFTFGLPWACLNVLATGVSLDSLTLLALALLARTALALAVGVGVVGDPQVLRDLYLLPLRDFFALGLWAWSYAGDTVTWRGHRFLLKRGKLAPLSEPTGSPLGP
jgi:ceramide glucosyltransferase